ncbi:phage tail protein, partial [Pelagibacterium lentulum]
MPVFTAIGAAVAGATGIAWLGTAAAAASQLVAGITASLIGKAMQGEPQRPRFQVQGQIQTGDDVPRSILFGWNATAGSKVYQNEWGASSAPQEFSTRVIALSDYPIRELRGMEVDGKPVTILWGQAHAQYGFPIAEYRKSAVFLGQQDHLWVKFYDGTQTSADSFLVNSVSSSERPYTSSRVGRGIAYAIVTSRAPQRQDGEEKPLFQGLPQYKFVTYGARLYDPSRDDTVGGNGPQRWNDPSTWGGDGDFLPPVQVYNLLRGIRWNNQWLYGLQVLNPARLPVENWIAAINKARGGIAGPDGTEPTYRAGGEIQVGAPVHIAIEGFLTACNGRMAETGGTYTMDMGAPGTPVMAFTDGDILSTEEQSFTPFFSLSDTVNGVSASYPNPSEGWNVKTAPALIRPDLEALDGNRRLLATVSLDLVPYKGQVQRLMKWALAEALRARRHTFVLGPEFRILEPNDIVRWTSARNGYVDKLFRVDGIVYKSNLDVIVDLTEVDPSDYDWNQSTDYRPVVDGPLQLVGPKPVPMTGWQVFPATIFDDQGRARRPSIEVRFASGVVGVERVRVQVRVAGSGDIVFDGEVPYDDPWAVILSGQFSPATNYEVRGIFIGPNYSEWSIWFSVLTPDIKLGPLDVIYGDINLDELGKQVEGLLDWMGGNIRDIIEEAQAQAVLTGDQELANAMQFDELRRSLGTVVGDLSAT